MRSVLLAAALILGSAAASWANSVNVGYIFLQQDDASGLVTFDIGNGTGPNESYPQFPVLDFLDFTDVSLTVNCGNASCITDVTNNQMSMTPLSSETIDLGHLSSGAPDLTFSFSSQDTFSSALVTVTFSTTNISQVDQGTGVVGATPFTGSATSTLNFTSSLGAILVPLDLGNIGPFDVGTIVDPQGTSAPVPEPAIFSLLSSGIGGVFLLRRVHKQRLS